MARVDFFLDRGTGSLYLNEVNTTARLHHHLDVSQDVGSLRACRSALLIDKLIALAIERHAEKQRLRTSVT